MGAGNSSQREITKAYTTLGLQNGATRLEIREAFKQLVLIHHPDKGGDSIKFNAVREAAGILLDSENPSKAKHQRMSYPDSSWTFEQTFDWIETELFETELLPPNGMAERKLPDIVTEVPLQHCCQAGTVRVSVCRQVHIQKKQHIGSNQSCQICNGRGVVTEVVSFGQGAHRSQKACQCAPEMRVQAETKIEECVFEVPVPARVRHGDKLQQLVCRGDEAPGCTPGDLVFIAKVDDSGNKGKANMIQSFIPGSALGGGDTSGPARRPGNHQVSNYTSQQMASLHQFLPRRKGESCGHTQKLTNKWDGHALILLQGPAMDRIGPGDLFFIAKFAPVATLNLASDSTDAEIKHSFMHLVQSGPQPGCNWPIDKIETVSLNEVGESNSMGSANMLDGHEFCKLQGHGGKARTGDLIFIAKVRREASVVSMATL